MPIPQESTHRDHLEWEDQVVDELVRGLLREISPVAVVPENWDRDPNDDARTAMGGLTAPPKAE